MIRVLRPTLPAELISARVFAEAFSSSLSSTVVMEEVPLLPWLASIQAPATGPTFLPSAARAFAAATRGFDFLCPDYHAIPITPFLLYLRGLARSSIRLLLVAHAPGAYGWEWALLRPLLLPGDLVIAPTRSARDVIRFLCPELDSFVRVIPHPIRALPSCASNRAPRIVSLGRLHPSKLVHRQVEAMATLAQRHVVVPTMQIAGPLHAPGAREVSVYARSLMAKIRRLGLEDHVELAGEIAGETAKASFLGGAQLLLNLSVSIEESFGKAVAEALGVGVPVLATEWNGLPETVGAGGACVPVADVQLGVDLHPERLADAIEQSMATPPTPEACRQAALRFQPQRVAVMYGTALEESRDNQNRWCEIVPSPNGMIAGAPDHGLLGSVAPLTEFSWHELFTFHVEEAYRLRLRLEGRALSHMSPGERLRGLVYLGVRAPLERFLAGLDVADMVAPIGKPNIPTAVDDYLDRVATAALARGTQTSRLACLHALATAEQVGVVEAGLALLREDGVQSVGIDFLQIELERQRGEYARAFQRCVAAEDGPLWGELATPRLRLLARICREWGRPGLALPWLRDWLTAFPDSPDSGSVWLDRCLNAYQTSETFLTEATDALEHARALLGDIDEVRSAATEMSGPV